MSVDPAEKQLKCPVCLKERSLQANFCMYCGFPFSQEHLIKAHSQSNSSSQSSHSEHEFALFHLADYDVLKRIGKGGMGEVFLAYDKICSRLVALKRIKPELKAHKTIYNRFLREAKITSQLAHPAIIPIYNLGKEKDFIYYTMPYLEGNSLKDIFKTARKQKGLFHKLERHEFSIPSLIRYFIPLCQSIAYAHSRHIIHRDIKPDNVNIGKYGEVQILDWGLAKYVNSQEAELSVNHEEEEELARGGMTLPGKVVGTVAYMAPERALGEDACILSDIYSLGVILYQILTLHFPFTRDTLSNFRQNWHKECWTDPSEVAPYREVPKMLARIAKKCLQPNPQKRYQTVEELLFDLENYIEGRGQWLHIDDLDPKNKSHWEFQENILIPQEMAITPNPEKVDWVNLMISKESFQGNIKLEATISLSEKSKGVGFLIGMPEASVRSFLSDGYCLWLSCHQEKTSRLFRGGVEVVDLSNYSLKPGQNYQVRIEKIDHSIYFYLDNENVFSYLSHLPLVGYHLGLFSRDSDYQLSDICVSVSSLSIKVSCLQVPDTLLANKNYIEAIKEYRQIANTFPGRTEGREAMFRAGIALLEKAKNSPSEEQKERLLQDSLEEFSKMHKSPGAPLEYLGKSLVYQLTKDNEEENKCFELAFRRFSRHPLIHLLQEHLTYRLDQSSKNNRLATYRFSLLALKFLETQKMKTHSVKIIQQLCDHWEPLYFLQNNYKLLNASDNTIQNLIAEISYRLGKPFSLIETLDKELEKDQADARLINNILFYLLDLGCYQTVDKKAQEALSSASEFTKKHLLNDLQITQAVLSAHQKSLVNGIQSFIASLPAAPTSHTIRSCLHLMELALKKRQSHLVFVLFDQLLKYELDDKTRKDLEAYRIWAYLMEKKTPLSSKVFENFSLQELSQNTSLLHFLYGCQLAAKGDQELASLHFSSLIDQPFPRTYNLGSYYLSGRLTRNKEWFNQAFTWEKRLLYRQLELYFICIDEDEQAQFYHSLEQKQYLCLVD